MGHAAAQPFARPLAFAPTAPDVASARPAVAGALALADAGPEEVHGLSGMVWCAGLLHVVSDQGELLTIEPMMRSGVLVDARLRARRPLLDTHGRALRGRARDAEGLALAECRAQPELIVSFEQTPRVVRYTVDGHPVGEVALPAAYARALAQAPGNSGLEGLTFSPAFGLVAGLEYPAQGLPRQIIALASDGRAWPYPPVSEGGALVGLETLPNGALLALERRFVSPFEPLIISLQMLRLATSAGSANTEARVLARFSSAEGWPVDNFEAVAVDDAGGIFLLSDDNANPRQTTLLVYLHPGLLEAPSAPAGAASIPPDCMGDCGNRAVAR